MLKLNFFSQATGSVSDKRIIERIRNNDSRVLGELFINQEKMVNGYIMSHGGSRDDVDDLLQEAIIVLWQKVSSGRFELTAKLSTFILSVVKNKWLAELRKRNRLTGDELLEQIPDGNPAGLEKLISKEKMELVHNALEQISETCKKLLLLFYFEERSMDDIAKILELANMNVAKSKKYQCKKALEKILIAKMTDNGREQ